MSKTISQLQPKIKLVKEITDIQKELKDLKSNQTGTQTIGIINIMVDPLDATKILFADVYGVRLMTLDDSGNIVIRGALTQGGSP